MKYATVLAPTIKDPVFTIEDGSICFNVSIHLSVTAGNCDWKFSSDRLEDGENIVELSEGWRIRQYREFAIIQKESLRARISSDDCSCLLRTFSMS